MLGRSRASALLILACFAGLVAHSEPFPAEMNSDIKVGDTTYKVVDRIVLPNAVVFHKPQNPKGHPCRRVTRDPHKNDENCGIPAGYASYGILGCGGAVSPIPETTAQTFARVPGKDAPNLFASIVGVHISKKNNEGELEIAVLACGPRIAVPIVQDVPHENGSSYKFNRIALSVSDSKRVAEFALRGIETRPETYRIAWMNEAVLFVVPFKALDTLKIEKEEGADEAQTRSIDLLHGEFVLGSYSAQNNRYTENIKREVVPAGHPPVRVVSHSR
jgi:hypothetical protein